MVETLCRVAERKSDTRSRSGDEMREETWFDGVKYGRVLERDRIIKLLEENWLEPMDWLSVIALIREEDKWPTATK
jgi:hypothetical protein